MLEMEFKQKVNVHSFIVLFVPLFVNIQSKVDMFGFWKKHCFLLAFRMLWLGGLIVFHIPIDTCIEGRVQVWLQK